MRNDARNNLSFLRLVIDRGCMGFGSLFFLIHLGGKVYFNSPLVLTFDTYLQEAVMAIVSGGIWGVLMWIYLRCIARARSHRSVEDL
jgi:hypothetical protein